LSHQGGVEPVGTIIGPRGSRIRTIQDQIHGEHIEVIEYTDDFDRYIVNVCSPGEIAGVAIQEAKTLEERRQITLVCKSDKLALLIGKKGANVRLISEMLKANIEIQSIEEAHQSGLEYKKIDVQSMQKQQFNRTFNKYRPNTDILSKYNTSHSSYKTSKVIENMVNETKAPISKKEKASFLDDFKSMNKDELFNELSSGNSNDDESDDINTDDYNNQK
jgi:N utilization substance protein A